MKKNEQKQEQRESVFPFFFLHKIRQQHMLYFLLAYF